MLEALRARDVSGVAGYAEEVAEQRFAAGYALGGPVRVFRIYDAAGISKPDYVREHE